MADLKVSDLKEMLNASEEIGSAVTRDNFNNLLVQIVDEDGNIYDIEDVKFNANTKTILIRLDHDSAD